MSVIIRVFARSGRVSWGFPSDQGYGTDLFSAVAIDLNLSVRVFSHVFVWWLATHRSCGAFHVLWLRPPFCETSVTDSGLRAYCLFCVASGSRHYWIYCHQARRNFERGLCGMYPALRTRKIVTMFPKWKTSERSWTSHIPIPSDSPEISSLANVAA